MVKKITLVGNNMTFEDEIQAIKRTLDEIVKGSFSAHNTRHENGGADEIDVVGLSGELADDQPPKAHKVSHQNGGGDEIDVGGLSGELADNQPPKAHSGDHENGGGDEISVAALSGLLADAQTPLGHEPDKHNLIGARAYLSVDQDGILASTWTKVLLDTEDYDEGADFDTGNNRYVVPTTGLYLITARVYMHDISGGARYRCAIYVGGVIARAFDFVHSNSANDICIGGADMFDLTATNQVELYVWAVAPNSDLTSGIEFTSMSVTFMGVK